MINDQYSMSFQSWQTESKSGLPSAISYWALHARSIQKIEVDQRNNPETRVDWWKLYYENYTYHGSLIIIADQNYFRKSWHMSTTLHSTLINKIKQYTTGWQSFVSAFMVSITEAGPWAAPDFLIFTYRFYQD